MSSSDFALLFVERGLPRCFGPYTAIMARRDPGPTGPVNDGATRAMEKSFRLRRVTFFVGPKKVTKERARSLCDSLRLRGSRGPGFRRG